MVWGPGPGAHSNYRSLLGHEGGNGAEGEATPGGRQGWCERGPGLGEHPGSPTTPVHGPQTEYL